MFRYCAVFVGSAIVCNSSEYFPWCFFNVIDALICRAGVLINNICVKYFRAYTFAVEVVKNFFAGAGRLNNNVFYLNFFFNLPFDKETCIVFKAFVNSSIKIKMSNFYVLICKWHINTFENLPIIVHKSTYSFNCFICFPANLLS